MPLVEPVSQLDWLPGTAPPGVRISSGSLKDFVTMVVAASTGLEAETKLATTIIKASARSIAPNKSERRGPQ